MCDHADILARSCPLRSFKPLFTACIYVHVRYEVVNPCPCPRQLAWRFRVLIMQPRYTVCKGMRVCHSMARQWPVEPCRDAHHIVNGTHAPRSARSQPMAVTFLHWYLSCEPSIPMKRTSHSLVYTLMHRKSPPGPAGYAPTHICPNLEMLNVGVILANASKPA
jgi:hypothetical protein